MIAVHPHHLSHSQVMTATYGFLTLLFVCEVCAVYHFYFRQEDVFAAGVVVTSWFKEAVKHVLEKLVIS